jgi:hypothetical protein
MVIEHHVPDVPDRQVQPTDGGILWHAVTKRDNGHFRETAGQGQESPAKRSAPSKIRTCAHGSGESKNLSLRPKQMLVSKQFRSAVGAQTPWGAASAGGGCEA